jgi:hypothetical protein
MPCFELKIALLALSLQRQAKADHTAQAITLLTKLYRLTCPMPSQLHPFPT